MTSRALVALLGTVAAAAGAVVAVQRRRGRADQGADHVLVATVLRPEDDLAAALSSHDHFGPMVDVTLQPAPGDRGTEIAVRRRPGSHDPDLGELRKRLRELKQTLEAGEVLRVTPRPEGHRRATPGGLLVDLVDRRSDRWGVS